MLNIVLCIAMNLGILVCFRLFRVFNIHTFQAIVINYIICVVTGVLFVGPSNVISNLAVEAPWFWIGIVLGFIFISTFYLMALTTQKYSITVSSIAAKMSLVIPVLISFLVLGIVSKPYTILNYLGMFLALPAIILGSLKPDKDPTITRGSFKFALPLLVFVASGLIDSSINYTNYKFLQGPQEAIFPIIIFSSAAAIGLVVLLVRRVRLTIRNLLGGMVLGIVNYFSIYFLIRSLSSFSNDGALVYPLINVGIILASALVSATLFKEKLSRLNMVGISLAIICIILISYQELFYSH